MNDETLKLIVCLATLSARNSNKGSPPPTAQHPFMVAHTQPMPHNNNVLNLQLLDTSATLSTLHSARQILRAVFNSTGATTSITDTSRQIQAVCDGALVHALYVTAMLALLLSDAAATTAPCSDANEQRIDELMRIVLESLTAHASQHRSATQHGK